MVSCEALGPSSTGRWARTNSADWLGQLTVSRGKGWIRAQPWPCP